MERSAIFADLRSALAEALEVDPTEIREESLLVEDLDADSIDLLEMVLNLKDRFGINIGDGEVKVLLTEMARFLPGSDAGGGLMSDDELAEVSRSLRVDTVVDFVAHKLSATA